MRSEAEHVLYIDVVNHHREDLPDASITIEPVLQKDDRPAPFMRPDFGKSMPTPVPYERGFRIEGLAPGRYIITVSREGYESERREIEIGTDAGLAEAREKFRLGLPGMLYYRRGTERIPVELPERPFIVVKLQPGSTEPDKYMLAIARAHDLEIDPSPRPNLEPGRIVFRFTHAAGKADMRRAIGAMTRNRLVERAMPALQSSSDSTMALTGDIHARFKDGLGKKEIARIIAEQDLHVVGVIGSVRNAYVLRHGNQPDFDVLAACEWLIATGSVLYADPVFDEELPSPLAPPPLGDALYPQEWHAIVSRLPEAWAFLNSRSTNLTYGSADLIAALIDFGTQSYSVGNIAFPSHQDLTGTVSNGSPKVLGFYDFRRSQWNHDETPYTGAGDVVRRRHGSRVIGIFGANVENTRGVAGVAGNVRVFPIFLTGGQIQHAESILWTAGLAVNWSPEWGSRLMPAVLTAPGNPLQQPTAKGADIISNSYTWDSRDIPLDNTSLEILKTVFRYGRNGRGSLVLFGGGEQLDQNDSNLVQRIQQLADLRAPEVMIISASGIFQDPTYNATANNKIRYVEQRARYSGYGRPQDGPLIDLCGPSANISIHQPPTHWGTVTIDYPGDGNLPASGGLVTHGGVPVLHVGGCVETTYTGGITGTNIITVGDGSGFVQGQRILIGDPTSDGDYTITKVIASDRLELDRQVVNRSVGAELKALSPEITELNGAVAAGATAIRVDEPEGLLINQKIVIGDPDDPGSEIRTITGATGDIINIAPPLLVNHSNDQPVYLLGGPPGAYGYLETVLTQNHTAGTDELYVSTTAGFAEGQAVMVGRRDRLPVRLEGGRIVSNTTAPGDPLPNIVAAEGHTVDDVESGVVLEIDSPNLFKDHASGTPVYGGAAVYTNNFSGTSSACPFVAGVAALVLSTKMDSNQQSTLTWREVRDILRKTADKIDLLNIGFTSSHGSSESYYGEANTVGAGKWYDRNNELLVTVAGSTGVLNLIEASTTLIQRALMGTRVISVNNSSNIVVGHALAIESESVIVRGKGADGHTLLVDPLTAHHDSGKAVTSGSTTLRMGTAAGNMVLDVNNSRAFAQGQAIQLGTGTSQEVFVIESITHPNTIHLNVAVENIHPSTTTVKGGRIPHYSHWYGHGRVNAEKAVKMAWDYSHDDRDLMIRNNLTDTGTALSTPIDSPDIWIRTSEPGLDLAAYPTSFDYGAPGPHQVPNINKRKWVGVRVANRGTKYHSLEARVTVFIALSSGVVPPGQSTPFPFPSAWSMTKDIVDLHDTLGADTYFLGETVLAEGYLAPRGYSSQDKTTIYVPWDPPSEPITVRTPLRCFVLAQITPHDGELNEPEADANNNLSYKEINFTEILFKKNTIDELQRNVPVKRSGDDVNLPYRIEIQDSLGLFNTLKIAIEARRRAVTGAEEIVAYSYNAVTGNWEVTNPKTWITFTPPVDINGNPPVASDSSAIFTGTLIGDIDYDLIELKVTVRESSGIIRAGQVHSIVLSPAPINYSTDSEIVASSSPRFHVFAEMEKIAQSADQAFGVKSPEQFRLTSSFSLRPPFTSVKAFAAVSGTVLIQRVRKPDGTYSSSAVNLILRPLRQSRVDFTPVKYFIYRGLRLSDFLTITGEHTTEVSSGTGVSEFIADVYHQHGIRRNLFIAQYPQQTPPDPIPSGKALGWDSLGQNDNDLLDSYFYRNDPSFQLPVVRRGMEIGEFDTTGDFGFEIVLEEGETHFPLEFARRPYYELNTNFLSETGQALKNKKQEILNFVDPAAYFGMHYFMGVETDAGLKKEVALYTDIVSVFHTRNMAYVDIRNEHGYSLNYYSNYRLQAPLVGHELKIAANPGVSSIVERPFETNGWPIMTLDNLTYTSAPMSSFALAFRMADNGNPVLYVESGQVNPPGITGRIIAGFFLFVPGDIWTKDIEFVLPNVSASMTDATARRYVSGVVKLHFARRAGGTVDWPVTVVKGDKFLDNVFGPVNVETFWTTNDPVKWISAQDKRFIEAKAADHTPPFAYMAERSVAIEPDRVIYYTTAIEYLDGGNGRIIKTKRLKGGHSSRGSFVEASSLFDGLNLQVTTITTPTEGDVKVPYFVKDLGSDTDPLDVLVLGISKTQQELLIAAGNTLNLNHERNIILADKYTPTSGTPYIRYTLKVRGLSASADGQGRYVSTDAPTASAIYVYTIDGLFYSSSGLGEIREVPQYEPDPEEKVTEDRSAEVSELINADEIMREHVNDFAGKIDDISASNPSVVALLTSEVGSYGTLILDQARGEVGTSFDDRPLYWARLKMAVKFKQHDYLNNADAVRNALVKLLEENSRGYDTVDFTGIADPNNRVLVIGFDPFALSPDLARSNPSGVAALKLHGATIGASKIQSIILPVRYRDFEDGLIAGDGKGIIEEKIEQYLTPGPKQAGMIVVLAENGSRSFFDVERFAARGRGRQGDNENRQMLQPIGVGSDWKEYYESSLPEDMVDDYNIPDPPQWVCLDQSYSYQRPGQSVVTANQPGEAGGVNEDEWKTNIVIPADAAMLKGSGGNYLFNETFYRIARLRDKLPSSTVVGMLSIPLPENTNPKLTISGVVDKVKELITKALDEL